MALSRIPRSIWIALVLALALVLWMLSGLLGSPEPENGSQALGPRDGPMTVAVREQSAEAVTRYLTNQGQTEADRLVTVKAETGGRVVEVAAEEGTRVAEGDLLARIAMNDRQARLREAEARVAQRESEYEAARNLGESGYQAQVRVSEAEAALASARARLAAIREDIANTEVTAPFAGFLEARKAEVGDVLASGSPVAVVADLDPLIVSVRIAQQRIGDVTEGTEAEIRLADGRSRTGTVRYLARTADAGTRTFRVEVAVPNPEAAVRAGLSAEVRIPVGEVSAHFVSPALLSLDDDGVLGIKTVTGDDRVAFHAVELVRAEPDGVWVTGLPQRARLITVGQGFAREGERVRPRPGQDLEGDGSQAGGAAPFLPGAREAP
ncbi:efflux RND transporter periplasmic adaptor subunit [Thiohalorhabdus sp.]|uniref:efflux RND transporter periplasmic adaptor subunit n=1 Tax=Thiohalorhabdus sp. TaxID=3094134 RepID=UPI002FC3CE50